MAGNLVALLMDKEFVIYCDESSSKERHFSDFYGGALIGSDDIDHVRAVLAAAKAERNLHGELKWTKITENYEEKYIEIVDVFFDLIERGLVKIRIMFTQNMFASSGVRSGETDNKYFMLYYQFIKHAFGLLYATGPDNPVSVRIYLDKLPDKKSKVEEFRDYLVLMPRTADYRASGIKIERQNIAEVNSHEHDILQCLDVILGSINFRLNDKHKDKPEGQRLRGKRTVAKERVYKHINTRIRRLYPNFNIGISTGTAGKIANRWHHPYRHWLFLPRDHIIVGTSKRKK